MYPSATSKRGNQMATIIDDVSRTFHEYLLLPGLTTAEHIPSNVSLKTPIQKYKASEGIRLSLNTPFVSAAMQSVSGSELAIALARKGGCAFIFCSQSIESQAAMVRQVKEHKAGFVESDSNLAPTATLKDALELRKRTGHSTIAITENGERHSKLLGILTSKDFWEYKDDLSQCIKGFYTPLEKLVLAEEGVSLQDATALLWKNKKECVPIVDKAGNLKYLVFRKDYYDHHSYPDELTDGRKRLLVGAALNTHDYIERAAALMEAGVDCLCLDSSDGYSEWQAKAAAELRKIHGDALVIGGGNVVSGDAFRYLVEKGHVDFVKVGIDKGTMDAQNVDNGEVIGEIGLAPNKPGEFIIFRFSQFDSGWNVLETA
jgi:IMP dehydrogenase